MTAAHDNDEVIARHHERHREIGTTVHVYFPAGVDCCLVDDYLDAIADMAYNIERDGWDPMVTASKGDTS